MIVVAEATIILCTFEGIGNGLNVNCYSDIDCPSTGNKRSLSLDNSNEKQPLKHFIQVCCTWGHKLANGTPYKIIGADAEEQQAVRSAVYKWNIRLKAIKITEATTNVNADIQVSFNSTAQKIHGSFGGVTASAGHTLQSAITAGRSINNFDENGFITSVKISISRSTFGNILGLSEI
jgi:hypothetical protein